MNRQAPRGPGSDVHEAAPGGEGALDTGGGALKLGQGAPDCLYGLGAAPYNGLQGACERPGVEVVKGAAGLREYGRDSTLVTVTSTPASRAAARARAESSESTVAFEVSDPVSEERGIVQSMLDPIARSVIAHLRAILPDRTEAEIHWFYQAMIGAMVFAMADAGRIKRLSGGAADPEDADAAVRHLLPLLLDGIRGRRGREMGAPR